MKVSSPREAPFPKGVEVPRSPIGSLLIQEGYAQQFLLLERRSEASQRSGQLRQSQSDQPFLFIPLRTLLFIFS